MKSTSKPVWIVLVLATALVLCSPSVSPAATEDNIYLETVGGFSGSYIYLSYAYIGVTADAFSKDLYQGSQVKVMMDETVSMFNHLKKQLHRVMNTNIVEEDRLFVQSMIEVLDLLKAEAEALSDFAVSNDKADLERYEGARKRAWPKIKQLLGIK